MEPQVDVCFKKDKKRRCCIDLSLFIISILLAFTIGLLVGALLSIILLLNLGAIVTFLVTLVVLLALRIITLICCGNKAC